MPHLELRGLRKSYDGKTDAVGGVSLAVEAGEIVTVLGPSGCGKSTLLRLVAGLERPDAGDVFLAGARVTDREPARRDVAMVFQSYALYPHMTVAENIAAPLRLRRRPAGEVRARVEEAAARLGLTPLLGRRPRALSGGERQRVALARAFVNGPALVLCDEPAGDLDQTAAESLATLLADLHAEHESILIVATHDAALASRCAVRYELTGGTLVPRLP
jgi:ABC-type sugar transport system ATPase subunit